MMPIKQTLQRAGFCLVESLFAIGASVVASAQGGMGRHGGGMGSGRHGVRPSFKLT